MGIHGDGVHIAPLNPWLHIYFATTGVNSFGDQVNGDQQLTRAGGAAAVHARQQLVPADGGQDRHRSKPGKLADLVVLDRDYFTVPDAEIKQIRSVLTIVDGRIVHDSERPS